MSNAERKEYEDAFGPTLGGAPSSTTYANQPTLPEIVVTGNRNDYSDSTSPQDYRDLLSESILGRADWTIDDYREAGVVGVSPKVPLEPTTPAGGPNDPNFTWELWNTLSGQAEQGMGTAPVAVPKLAADPTRVIATAPTEVATTAPTVTAPPIQRTADDDIRDFFATEPTAQEVFDAMQQYDVTPQQVIDVMGLDPVKAMADYNTFLNPPAISTTTGPVTGGEPPSIQVSTGTGEIEETPVLGTGTFSTVQNVLNDVGRRVGEGLDKVFDILGIPRPDYTVIQPRAPGATVVWGQPSGSVFGRVGTTPGGNVVGVQTGIPALDVIIGKVSDILTGRATSAADVFGLEDLKKVILETAKGELGIPDLNDPGEILKAVLDASNLTDEEKNKILVDTTKKDQGSGADRAVTGNDDVDRILSGGADRVVTKSDDVDRILKTAGERTTDRNPDLDTLDDRASDFNNFISTLIGGGGLGLGVGAGGGALQVTDPLYAEIEYLYDMLDILPQNLRDEYSDEELVDMLSTLPKNSDTQERGRR